MKTLLIDNSLCSLPLRDDADPDLIYHYICALADAGVQAVELDFRALMKINRYPKNMKYIFRLVDPVFLSITDHFEFDYVAVSYSDLRKCEFKNNTPIMLSLPVIEESMSVPPSGFFRYVSNLTNGKISLINFYGSYPILSREEIKDYFEELRRSTFIPFNLTPMNDYRSAVSNAINFTICGADAVTVTTGSSARYCSLEDYFSYFTSIMHTLPKGLNFPAAAAALKLNGEIFKTGFSRELDRLIKEMRDDFIFLSSGETGERILQGNAARMMSAADDEPDEPDDLKNFSVYHNLGRKKHPRGFLQ